MTSHKKAMLLLIVSIFAVNQLQSQVTIGSNDSPEVGALLQLQEQDYGNGINARKGLMLPRVNLTDLNNLYPMFTSGYNKASEDSRHTGLTVYHTDGGVECPAALSGVYTWDGKKWQPLAIADIENDPSRPQSTFADNEGNTYTYKKIGNKYWMTQNVRSLYQYGNKNNPPLYKFVTPTSSQNEFPCFNPGMNRSTDDTSIKLVYPDGTPAIPDPSGTVVMPAGTVTYKEEGISITLSYQEFVERFGLLYTYNLSTKACPEGWTMPTDDDWLNLIRHVDNNPSATITTSTEPKGNTAASKLKANSYIYTSSDPVNPPQPVSFKWNGCTTKQSGFGAVPNGYVQYMGRRGVYFAEKVQYWGTDPSGTLTGLYYSFDYRPNATAVTYGNNAGYYNSVRCVRDTPPN